MTGGQKKIDMNKNNKIDSEDFKMLRNKKMAKGGAVKPMAKGGPIKMRTGKLVKAKAKGSNTGGVKRVAKNKRDGIAQRGKTRA